MCRVLRNGLQFFCYCFCFNFFGVRSYCFFTGCVISVFLVVLLLFSLATKRVWQFYHFLKISLAVVSLMNMLQSVFDRINYYRVFSFISLIFFVFSFVSLFAVCRLCGSENSFSNWINRSLAGSAWFHVKRNVQLSKIKEEDINQLLQQSSYFWKGKENDERK